MGYHSRRITMDWHFWTTQEVSDLFARLTRIESKLDQVTTTEAKVMGVLDDIEAEVAANTTVEGSIETLVNNIVEASGNNPARMSAVLATLQANDTRLAKLVTTNTTAATPGPVPPPAPAAPA